MDFGFRRADQVIVHGSQLQDVVQEATGISRDRIHVIPHIAVGLDAAQQTAPTVNEDDTILFFGRIWEYKGLEYLIRAQPHISKRFPDVRVVIGGRGEDFARYRQLMVDPNKFVVHNRWISDEERAQLFAAASVVVLPYVEATQSGVVPLAYAHGKPVVATRTGGLPDCVDHEQTGLLVPPRDEVALAEAVTRLLADPDLRRRLGEAGRQKLAEEFSPDVIAARTAEVYQLAIEQHRGGVGTTVNQQEFSSYAKTPSARHSPACGRVGLSGPERVVPGRPDLPQPGS
jgi:glycosyltransferase involved in cell wall biosynthesis